MAYVIAEPCINTKDTACVDACPVDCIHPKKDSDKFAAEEMLYIDPVECIDCGACVPVCPVSDTAKASTPVASRSAPLNSTSSASPMLRLTLPTEVNLTALDSRLRTTCSRRCSSTDRKST